MVSKNSIKRVALYVARWSAAIAVGIPVARKIDEIESGFLKWIIGSIVVAVLGGLASGQFFRDRRSDHHDTRE